MYMYMISLPNVDVHDILPNVHVHGILPNVHVHDITT